MTSCLPEMILINVVGSAELYRLQCVNKLRLCENCSGLSITEQHIPLHS